MRRRRAGTAWRTLTVALAGAACAAWCAVPAAGAAQSTATSGIGATWTTAEGSWAALPMGHLHSAENTFWELFFRPSGSSRWTLVTPPGVASNGGIVAASTPASTATVTVGFQPSKYLRYSPVARTTDAGQKWSTGTLPSSLAQVADALATGPGGEALALERGKGGTLVRAGGSLTRWSTVTTGRALAATGAGAACGVRSLTAVTVASGAPELGGDCTKPGVVGLFTEVSGAWEAAGPQLSGEAAATMRVLRLTASSAGTAALVEARSKGSDSLLALWRQGDGTWTTSAPVRVTGQVLSAGISTDLSVLAVTSEGSGSPEVHTVSGPGAPWAQTAAPKGTQAVVGAAPSQDSGPGVASMTALAVSGSWLTVWSRSGGPWLRGRRVKVPIEYGSST